MVSIWNGHFLPSKQELPYEGIYEFHHIQRSLVKHYLIHKLGCTFDDHFSVWLFGNLDLWLGVRSTGSGTEGPAAIFFDDGRVQDVSFETCQVRVVDIIDTDELEVVTYDRLKVQVVDRYDTTMIMGTGNVAIGSYRVLHGPPV